MSVTHEVATSGRARAEGGEPAQAERILTMSPEADEFLADLARKTGLREGEVVRLALGLFATAVEAKEQGKHFGIAESPDGLDVEIVGF